MKTLDVLKKTLERDIEKEKMGIALHNVVLGVIKEKWNGKTPNARIKTQVEEKLKAIYKDPALTVSYNKDEDGYWTRISVWGVPGAEHYGDRIEMQLTSKLDPTLDPTVFDERLDARYGSAARLRNVQREALLKDVPKLLKLAAAIDAVKESREYLETMMTVDSDDPLYQLRYDAVKLAGL